MNKIKQILTNENTKLKIISFLTALFLWSYVMGIVNPDRTVEYRGINVKETGLDYIEREGFSIVQPSDPKVNVTVSGKRSDLENISSENIIVKADLQGIKEGDTRIPLTYSIEPHTGDVEIVDVNPSSIVISVESIVTETLKIEVEALGDLPEGFTLGNINVLNNYVRVEAPKSQIEKIDRVLAYIDVTDKTNTFTTNSEIVFLDKNDIRLDGIKSDTQKIDIEVPVFKIKSVPVEPVFIV
jgi:YbbR domain-containing protein